MQKTTRRQLTLALATALVVGAAAYHWRMSSGDDLPTPPLSLPFDPSVAGSKVVQRFRVTSYDGFTIGLTFIHRGGAPTDPMDRLRVAGVPLVEASGRLSEREVAAALRVKVRPLIPASVESERQVDVRSMALSSYMGDRSTFTVDRVRLRPGTYELEVFALGASRASLPSDGSVVLATHPKSGGIKD